MFSLLGYYPWGSEPLVTYDGYWISYVVYPFGDNGYVARGHPANYFGSTRLLAELLDTRL